MLHEQESPGEQGRAREAGEGEDAAPPRAQGQDPHRQAVLQAKGTEGAPGNGCFFSRRLGNIKRILPKL